jgi:predicted TPR repeat methyltransferase
LGAAVTHDPLASIDLIAQRRYAYGKAVADDGDFAAAAEMFAQALEKAPNWAPAWFALAEAREKLCDAAGAAEAFRRMVEADPSDVLGALPRLALLERTEAPAALPPAYVTRLFDDYAPRFETHLTDRLGYRGPVLVVEALEDVAQGRRFANALDIGCGTGLLGEAARARADRLTGVDLSPAMIAKAREKNLYDALETADALGFLERSAEGAFDLILAADALCYFGELGPIFAACRRALADDGLFAFSLETFEGDGCRLPATMRFALSREYLERTAEASRLPPLLIRPASTRLEAGAETPGLVCVLGAATQTAAFENGSYRTIRPAPAPSGAGACRPSGRT